VRDEQPATEHRASFRTQHQILAGPRPSAPQHIVFHKLRRLAAASQPHDLQRVARYVIGDGHLADDPHQFLDMVSGQRRHDFEIEIGRRALHDLELFLQVG
jgi:hypothetical protein